MNKIIDKLTGSEILSQSGNTKQAIIFLHGWGADGDNLIGLHQIISHVLKDAVFLSPNAPHVCEANPFGYEWYGLLDRSEENIMIGIKAAAKIVKEYIEQVKEKYNIKENQIILFGFSQGAMTALYTALRMSKPLKAVISFAGRLELPENLEAEIKSKPPILLIHGDQDPVVPYAAMRQAVIYLQKSGVKTEIFTAKNTDHSIDNTGLDKAIDFIKNLS